MKSFKLVLVLVFALFVTGCAAPMQGRYGQNNAGLLGGSGAVLGSALTKSNPVVGAVVGGLTGYYVGQEMDRQSAEQGSTDCRATLRRTYNRDGSIASVQQNTEYCRSTSTTPGYRVGYNR